MYNRRGKSFIKFLPFNCVLSDIKFHIITDNNILERKAILKTFKGEKNNFKKICRLYCLTFIDNYDENCKFFGHFLLPLAVGFSDKSSFMDNFVSLRKNNGKK